MVDITIDNYIYIYSMDLNGVYKPTYNWGDTMLNGMYRTCITHVCILSGYFSGLQGFFQDIHDLLSSDTGVSQNPHTKWPGG